MTSVARALGPDNTSVDESTLRYVAGSTDAVPNPEAVEQLLGLVQRFMEDERARGQALDAKTSTLAGFSGAILALTATLGAALFDRDLGAIAPAVQAHSARR